MVEVAATVFVLVVAHIYIRAYIGMGNFVLIVGLLFAGLVGLVALLIFPTQTMMVVGGIALLAALRNAGVRNGNPFGKDGERRLLEAREQWQRERRLGKRII